MRTRLPALDWLRGFVMVLMTVDHASGVFNTGRLMTDGVALYTPGTPLPTAQFLVRWATHLCAPTFVFLAGAALALSVARRQADGESAGAIDQFIVRRGLFIAALDPVWMSWVFSPGHVLLQVLYAIGGSLVAMAVLRRLRPATLLAFALGVLAGGEVLIGAALWLSGGSPNLPIALLLTGGRFDGLIVAYPLLPWLAMMALGWCCGSVMLARPPTGRQAFATGLFGLALFGVLRGANGYGNLRLLREDGSLVQWLHVSKYPPSLSFAALELGLMALLGSAFLALEQRAAERWLRPLRVLGQTALFFYVLHVHLLTGLGWAAGWGSRGGLTATLLASAATLLVLYPACAWYRGFKVAHPRGWTRYL